MSHNEGFSIITPTCRPQYIERLISNFLRQEFNAKELIVVINNDNMNINDFNVYVNQYSNIKVYKLPQETTLGECLNFGVSQSTYSYIAKFDDDDFYGRFYLQEAHNAFINYQSDVVGKVKIHYYFDGVNELRLSKWGLENQFVSWIAGPTICFKKDVFEKVKFRNLTLGEDVAFCQDCINNTISIFATSRNNYIIFRCTSLGNHTWKVKVRHLYNATDPIARRIKFDACNKYIDII